MKKSININWYKLSCQLEDINGITDFYGNFIFPIGYKKDKLFIALIILFKNNSNEF